MITRDDLNWWLELAPTLEWTFAKTYTTTAPHHYVVQGRTPEVSHDDLVRAARVIHTFGTPGKYYSMTKIYLVSPDGKLRWWTEDKQFTDTTLVNRAPTELLYGIQNAPSTESGIDSAYDGVATTWDDNNQMPAGSAERIGRLLAPVRGKYPPHVLDIGCGTGRALDLELVSPVRYAGIDSSKAMLNVLLMKHSRVAGIYPRDIRDALQADTFTPGQFDWVFLDSTIDLTVEERAQVDSLARLAVVETNGAEWTVLDVSRSSRLRIVAHAQALKAEA